MTSHAPPPSHLSRWLFFSPIRRYMEATDPLVRQMTALLPYALTEQWEERAAILEFEANCSRDLAEARALLLVIWQQPSEVLTAFLSAMRKPSHLI